MRKITGLYFTCFNTVNGMTVHVTSKTAFEDTFISQFQYRKRYDSARNTNMFSTFASTLVCFNTVNGMTVHVTDEKLLFEQGYRCFNTVNGMTVHVTLCLAPLKIPRPMMQNRKTSLIFPFYSIKIS